MLRWLFTLTATLVLVVGSGALHIRLIEPALAQASNVTAQNDLPVLQAHPLPSTLAEWHDSSGQGDYFSAIESTPAGYLIWSEFPVAIYVEPPTAASENSALSRDQLWYDAVLGAIEEWNRYLPLALVTDAAQADIVVWRRSPPLMVNGQQLRARAAETRYEFYIRSEGASQLLAHRFTILLRPDQTASYTQASARHELGHALGLWGHSPVETDALYFAQVRSPAPISVRDVNTLKRVYQQPTRLGWPIQSGS